MVHEHPRQNFSASLTVDLPSLLVIFFCNMREKK